MIMARALSAAAAAAAALRMNAGPYECNMLTVDPEISCLLPFPSDFWNARYWNASAPPGLTLSSAAFPVDKRGNGTDPTKGGYNSLEGGTLMGPIMSYVPGLSLDLSGAPRLWNISSSVGPTASTILLNTQTGEAVEHWVELDHSGDGESGAAEYERMLLLWPSRRLVEATSYIVAFRGLLDDSGVPVAAPDGFAALRDKVPTSNPAIEAARPAYEGLFATLEKAGWARDSLTLAWSYTTNSFQNVTGRFLAMREDAFARVEKGGFKYNIVEVVPPSGDTGRLIRGFFSVPIYLTTAQPSLQSRLVLDPATGLPVYQRDFEYEFTVIIPNSVLANPAPSKVLQYGHGLFGSQGEVKTTYLVDEANNHSYILGAVNWIGMDFADEPTIIAMILGLEGGWEDFAIIPDRLHQGVLNFLLFMKFLTSSDFTTSKDVVIDGIPVISTNASDWHYFGNSQGGIMGAVYMAVTTDVVRGLCGVPGGPYALLLPRSKDFSDLFALLKARYPRSIDRMSLIGLIQLLWDRMDPSGWVSYIPGGLPNTPAHRTIFHYGLGDAQVTWLAAQQLGRSVDAVFFEGQPLEGNQSLADFKFVPADEVLTAGNAIVGFDFDFPEVPFVNVPPQGFDAHECPRRVPAGQAQMFEFFESGRIINYCGASGCHANQSVC